MVEKTLEMPDEPFTMVVPEYGPCDCDNDDETQKKACAEETKVAEVKKPAKDKMCYKCKVNKATVTNKQEVSCKDCLMFMLTHRFKNAIVRYVRIQKDYPNLVAVSGGSNSMAMLHLLHNCLNGNKSTKKMFFKVHILFIDEGTIYGWTQEQRDQNRKLVEQACANYGFGITTVMLESVFDVDHDTKNVAASVDDMDSDAYKQSGASLAQGPHVLPVSDFS